MTRISARRRARQPGQRRAVRPTLESLEPRFLLYATTGGYFGQPKRITYSFIPDGTSIGGVSSNLFQTLNARTNTANWQLQFARAAAAWQKYANINLVQVPDGGQAIGVSGNQQGDSRFGDIRIGGFAQSSNQLAFAYLPPPFNGGTSAGDMFFNTNQSWRIDGTTYDLMTVAIHEFGHALGMDHSSATTSAAMWPSYTGSKQTLATDDVNGIRTVYNGRQNDYFDASGANEQARQADDITPWINSSGQLAISGLDSTTPVMIGQGGDVDWYKITVPATTTGVMVVKMQSSGLSVLSPHVAVFNAAGTTMLDQDHSTSYGDTVTVTLTGVVPGQVYSIRSKGYLSGDSSYGVYGLQVNFTGDYQAPIRAPNTSLAETVSRGGGSLSEGVEDPSGDQAGDGGDAPSSGEGEYWVYNEGDTLVSENTGEVVSEATGGDPSGEPTADGGVDTSAAESIAIGSLQGAGDSLMTDGSHGPSRIPIPRPPARPPAQASLASRAILPGIVSLSSTSGGISGPDAPDASTPDPIGPRKPRGVARLQALDHALELWRS